MRRAIRIRHLLWGALFAAFWRTRGDAGAQPAFSLILRGATVVDGSGAPRVEADVGIAGDRIVAVGDLAGLRARRELDVRGRCVAPGFVNMLSWATESLIADPRSESDVRQGVTLEIFGEGWSMGPLTPQMRRDLAARQGEFRFDVDWATLGEYLERLEARGVVPNVASFVGATTVRVHELGYADREPTRDELARMCDLVRQAMREGALGVGSALIYAPAAYARPAELRALAAAAAEFGGSYITHLRSESTGLLGALDEALAVARETGAHTEIYHLKAAGRDAWPLLDAALARIEAARAEGLDVSANMYPYTAGASGLDAAMPPWVQEGGHAAWLARLRDPAIRRRIVEQIRRPGADWDNLYFAAGGAENVVLLGFRNPGLEHLAGRTLAEVAAERGVSPEEALVDLVLEDDSRVTVAYFMMAEDNVRRQLALPWVAIGSDEESLAPRGAFLRARPHPRAYGAFARFLGHYVRDQGVVALEEAVRRITSMPAQHLGLVDRGLVAPGCFADLVVFDPAAIADHSTFAAPHRFASGVEHVLVNGQFVLEGGVMTGARPGRFVRGPGWHRPYRSAGATALPRAAG